MSRTGGADGPEDVDATFAEIVADLRAQGFDTSAADAAAAEGTDDPTAEGPVTDGPVTDGPVIDEPESDADRPQRPLTASGEWRPSPSDWEDTVLGDAPTDDDEHFVPPEPPPLPRPRKGAFVVLMLFVLGVLLLVAPGVIGLATTLATPLGILALAAGLALALLRVKQGPPDGADPSNGAQV